VFVLCVAFYKKVFDFTFILNKNKFTEKVTSFIFLGLYHSGMYIRLSMSYIKTHLVSKQHPPTNMSYKA